LTLLLCLAVGSSAFTFPTPCGVAAESSTSTRLYGIGATLRRARDSLLDRERSREDLKIGIAGFYDRSSKLWEDVWGEVRFARWRVATRVSYVVRYSWIKILCLIVH
jgi:hypothetical protein